MTNKYFIANKEIKGTVDTGKKTPLGDIIYEVNLENDRKAVMPAKRLELQKSEKVCDLTASRDNFIKPLASMVFGMLHEYGMRINEIDYFCQVLVGLVKSGADKANEKMWGVEDIGEISLNQVNEVLLKDEESNKGTKS